MEICLLQRNKIQVNFRLTLIRNKEYKKTLKQDLSKFGINIIMDQELYMPLNR